MPTIDDGALEFRVSICSGAAASRHADERFTTISISSAVSDFEFDVFR